MNGRTVSVITAGLYKICTPTLIRSINSASAVSDKLGHSCKKSGTFLHPEEECAQMLLRRGGKRRRRRSGGGMGGNQTARRGHLCCGRRLFSSVCVCVWAQDKDQQRVSSVASALRPAVRNNK